MIESIQIKGFQSLHDVSLELGKLTVVVGSSNVGKSAVIRAIKALVENRRGDTFISDGKKECQVALKTNSGFFVWKKTKKSSGTYYFTESDTNFQQVPHETVLRLLRLGWIELGKTKLLPNFQHQLSPPFLLSESDAQKSKVLGEITNANLILLASSHVKRELRSISYEMDFRIGDLNKAKIALQRFEGIDALNEQLQIVKVRIVNIPDTMAYLKRLLVIHDDLKTTISHLNEMEQHYHSIHPLYESLEVTVLSAEKSAAKLQTLQYFKSKILDEVEHAKRWKNHMDLLAALPSLGVIERRIKDLSLLEGYVEAIQESQSLIGHGDNDLQLAKEKLLNETNVYDFMRKDIGVCPLCESVIQ